MNENKSDSGSVLVFGIGLGIIALLIITASVNISVMWVTKTKLNSVADAVALAASHSIDNEYLYRNGVTGQIWLNRKLAENRAQNYLEKIAIASELKTFRLTSLNVERDQVQVTLTAEPKLPFSYLMPGLDPLVLASGNANLIAK